MLRSAMLSFAMLLVGVALCACATKAEQLPGATSKVKVSAVAADGGKQTMLVASAVADSAVFFTRPPYDLNGSWRVEATVGVYDDKHLAATANAIFGLEADLRGSVPLPTQFYGVYARHFDQPAGLQVFASSNSGNHGQKFFDDARSVDLAISTDGTTVTYFARDAAVGGAYFTIGSRTLQSPNSAHQAGFGVFGAAKSSSFGFTNFRVPKNGTPSVAPPPEQDAMNGCFEAALLLLEAAYAVDGPSVGPAEVNAAQGHLDEARAALAQTRAKIVALTKAPEPKDRALKAVDKALKEIDKAKKAFGKKGPKEATPFLRAVATRLFGSAVDVTDALIPDSLRQALPGGGI
jgi:hypothetical protein